MYAAYHAHSPRTPPSPPNPKVILQREYREKEGECFNALRDVIKDLTGEELRTRQEILRKAIDILLTTSEVKKQSGSRTSDPPPHKPPSPTDFDGVALAHAGYFTPSAHLPQSLPSNTGFDTAFPYYSAQTHDQQYHVMSDMDPTLTWARPPEYGEDWSDYDRMF